MVTYIVACGAKKENYSCMAKDMYIGGYFKTCLKYAKCFSTDIYVLSAKYGLLELTSIIEPYNVTFGSDNSITVEQVKQQAKDLDILNNEIVIVGGKKYVNFAKEIWQNVNCPLSGGLLKQISWMNNEIKKYNEKRSLF